MDPLSAARLEALRPALGRTLLILVPKQWSAFRARPRSRSPRVSGLGSWPPRPGKCF